MPTNFYEAGRASTNTFLDTSTAFEQAYDKEIDKGRAQRAEAREVRKQRLMELNEEQKYQAQFQVDTGDLADQYKNTLNNASNSVADKAAEIRNQVKNGELEPAEAGRQLSELTQTVQQLNGSVELAKTQAARFATYQTSGGLSRATSGDALSIAKGFADGTIVPEFDPETKKMIYKGKDAEGKEINIPADKFEGLPGLIEEVPVPDENINGVLAQVYKTKNQQAADAGTLYEGNFFDAEAEEAVKTSFDQLFQGPQGRDNQMSMAMDHFGMDYEEAKELVDTIGDNGGTALEEELDSLLVEKARGLHIGSKIKKQEPLSVQEQAYARQLGTERAKDLYGHHDKDPKGGKGGSGTTKPPSTKDVEDARFKYQQVQTAISRGNYAGLANVGNIKYIRKGKLYTKTGPEQGYRLDQYKDDQDALHQLFLNEAGITGSLLPYVTQTQDYQGQEARAKQGGNVDYSDIQISRKK